MSTPSKQTAESSPCLDPATGEVIGHSPLDTAATVGEAITRAREVQPAWAATPVAERSRRIRRIRDHLVERADELADIVSRDNGKTRTDALVTEVLASAMAADYYARHAARFLKPVPIGAGSLLLANKRSRLHRVPYGVVGIVSPWNYPFSIPFSEVVMGLLAGNAVVLKTASETQLVGRALEAAVGAAGLPEGVFHFVNVPGRIAGDAMVDGGVDKLFFTGSVSVGKVLMAKAAERLVPLVLELGGNDAMLVCEDADPERAAAGAAWAGFQNSGQSCGGVERVYVHRRVAPAFLAALKTRVEALRVGPGRSFDVDIGAMTTSRQMETVRRQVDEALAQGAVAFARSAAPEGGAGQFLPAMVLTQVDHRMTLMREETFGPVVGVMEVDDMEEAVALANDSDLGLTGSVWSRDRRRAEALGRRIKAGVITINDHLMSHGLPETPWGGFKASGIGRTHGRMGFDEMTQPQVVVTDVMPFVRRDMWWHPHGEDVYEGIKGVLHALYGRGVMVRLRGALKMIRLFSRSFRP